MADRRVTHTDKDDEGDITALCNPWARWGPRSKQDAVADIEDGEHTYHVLSPAGERSDVHVVDDEEKGKYLRTDPDGAEGNNLGDLPDC